MKLSRNFSLSEFTKSSSALRLEIDNTPQGEHLEAAKLLFESVVQPVRDEFGLTVINSGYRCPALNEAIGGAKTSQHCKGEAADIEVPGTANIVVAKWIQNFLEFDQLILEFYSKNDPSAGWVHISYKKEGNRNEALTATKDGGSLVYIKGLPF